MPTKPKTKPEAEKIVQLIAPPEVARGNYANAVKVIATDSEVVIDFAFLTTENETTNGVLVSRQILPLAFATKVTEAINNAVKEHEEKVQQQKHASSSNK